jgi:hypothetical protein
MGAAIFMEAEAGSDGDIGPPGPPGPAGATGPAGASGLSTTIIVDSDNVSGGDEIPWMPWLDPNRAETWASNHLFNGAAAINRQPTATEVVIPANADMFVDEYYQLGAGQTVAIGAGGELKIGDGAGMLMGNDYRWDGRHVFNGEGGVPVVINSDGTSINGLLVQGSNAGDVNITVNTEGTGDAYFRAVAAGVVNWSFGTQRSTGSWILGPVVGLGTPKLTVTQTGDFTIAAPTAGVALTINLLLGQYGLIVQGDGNSQFMMQLFSNSATSGRNGISFLNTGAVTQSWVIGNDLGGSSSSVFQIRNITSASFPFSLGTDGAFTFAATTSGSNPILTLGAGGANTSPLQFTSSGGTLRTTASAGAQEYDGTAKYFAPAASSRAVDLCEYMEIQSGTHTLTSQTAAQKLLNATTNGAITLPIGTYEFECYFFLTSMSSSSGAFGFALGGAATFTQTWLAEADKVVTLAAANATAVTSHNTTANVAISPTNTSTNGWARISGIIRVTVAGTVIPQVSLGVAAAAIVGVNSFFRCRVLGLSGFTNVGNWS